MADYIVMPKLGFDMREGVLNRWLKGVGDPFSKREIVAEIESDKATLELESHVAGTLLHLLHEAGDVVPVGANMAIVGQQGEDISGLAGGNGSQAAAVAAAPVAAEEVTKQAPSEVPVSTPPTSEVATNDAKRDESYPGGVKATSVARRLAGEKQINLLQVKGSGPDGRKWGRLCGLALFLPHGYEGQGPEHSSARLERFLQLCAENNMQVCVPSTPAQMYHMIRRQMLRSFRKPLIVMTPKSLLRHDLSVSTIDELAQGRFANVLDEIDDLPAAGVRRVVFCSGKVYFDLLKARRKDSIRDVALVRIEQLYPFPADEYEAVLRRYPAARDVVWCQEEPQNQGAWYQIRHRLQERLPAKVELLYAGRPHAAAPANGILKVHELEQAALIEAALRSQSTEDAGRETTRLTATGVRKKS